MRELCRPRQHVAIAERAPVIGFHQQMPGRRHPGLERIEQMIAHEVFPQ